MSRENFIRGVPILFKTKWTIKINCRYAAMGGHDSEDKRLVKQCCGLTILIKVLF